MNRTKIKFKPLDGIDKVNSNVYNLLNILSGKGLFSFSKTITTVKCLINWERFSPTFSYFLEAFDNLYKLDWTGSQISNTVGNMILVFVAFFKIHSSKVYDVLKRDSKEYRLPKFIVVFLKAISIPIRSFTENNAFLIGRLNTDRSFEEIFNLILKMNKEELRNWISFSKTSVLFDKIDYFLRFKDELNEKFSTVLKAIDRLTEEGYSLQEAETIICMTILSKTNESCHPKHKGAFPMENVTFTQAHSKHMSIFRFSNIREFGDTRNTYQIDVASLKGLSESMMTIFSCFIYIFRPWFNTPDELMPRYEKVSLLGLNETNIWELYLSSSVVTRFPGNDGAPRRRRRTTPHGEEAQQPRPQPSPPANTVPNGSKIAFIDRWNDENFCQVEATENLLFQMIANGMFRIELVPLKDKSLKTCLVK